MTNGAAARVAWSADAGLGAAGTRRAAALT